MSHLITLFYGKPSLHLSALRARGLELDRLFEVTDTRSAPGKPVTAEDRIAELKASRTEDMMSPKHFDELCLNED